MMSNKNMLSEKKSDPGSISAFHMITTDLIQTDGSDSGSVY